MEEPRGEIEADTAPFEDRPLFDYDLGRQTGGDTIETRL